MSSLLLRQPSRLASNPDSPAKAQLYSLIIHGKSAPARVRLPLVRLRSTDYAYLYMNRNSGKPLVRHVGCKSHAGILAEVASLLSLASQRATDLAEMLRSEAEVTANLERQPAEKTQALSPESRPTGFPEAMMSVSETARFLGLARQTIWAMRKAGTFPEPIKISARRRAFRAADIGRWLNDNSHK